MFDNLCECIFTLQPLLDTGCDILGAYKAPKIHSLPVGCSQVYLEVLGRAGYGLTNLQLISVHIDT